MTRDAITTPEQTKSGAPFGVRRDERDDGVIGIVGDWPRGRVVAVVRVADRRGACAREEDDPEDAPERDVIVAIVAPNVTMPDCPRGEPGISCE